MVIHTTCKLLPSRKPHNNCVNNKVPVCSKNNNVGSPKISNVLFCRDLSLKRASHSVSALGVTFTTLSGDVVKLNYELQLEKIQNLLKAWQGRDFSLIGKITIKKSLAISKLVFSLHIVTKPREHIVLLTLKKLL